MFIINQERGIVMHLARLAVCTLVFVLVSSWSIAVEFPYRKDYPNVPIIEIADLKKGYDDGSILIIDVRSSLEFNTIHPKGAYHVSLSNVSYKSNLKELVAKHPDKKIALYCNGTTCLKSYKATQKAMEEGIKDVYAFDAGIPAWANAYPSETLLVGKKITDPKKQLIPKSDLVKVSLDFEAFKKKAAEPGSVVIDVRDPMQRAQKFTEFENVLPIPLDKLINNIIEKNRMKDKQLIIFDQVGKQVRWLMYYLEDNGYKNYYFLKGGATAVFKEQKYRY